MCDPQRKEHQQRTNTPSKCRQHCDHNHDKVIKDSHSRAEGSIFEDEHNDHGPSCHRDKSSQSLCQPPKPSHCHTAVSETSFTLSTAACSAFSYSSSSPSSSFSSFFSSSSSASSSSLNSNTSSECVDRCAFKKPWYSQSCTDVSGKHRYFEEDCDTEPLIDKKNSSRCSAKNKLGRGSAHSPVQECLHKTQKIPSGFKTDGNVRKSKSMEALVRSKDDGGHGNEDEYKQGKRESEVRKKIVKEKMKFSAFLNEITRQVLSPVRLTTLGVKDAHPSCRPHQACDRSKKNEKRQRSQSGADPPSPGQFPHSSTQSSLSPKSFHQNLMQHPAQSVTGVSPRTGSSTDLRCLERPPTHRHHRCSPCNKRHQHKGDHTSTHRGHECKDCSSQCHHHHPQTHDTAHHPEEHHNTVPHSRGHNKLHHHGDQPHGTLHHKDHPHEEHHLGHHHRHGVHHHGDPHHRDHEQGDYCYGDHHGRHYSRDSNSPTPSLGHHHHRNHRNHHSDAYHFHRGDEHGQALHCANNVTNNRFRDGDDSDCRTRRYENQTPKRPDGYNPRTKEDQAMGLPGDHDSAHHRVQISSYNKVDSSGHIRDHRLDHHSSSEQEAHQRSACQHYHCNSYSDGHHHYHHHQHGNYGCPDQLNHDDCISPGHHHYHRNNNINSLPHHHDHHHQSEAYSYHHDDNHYSKSHPYHHDNQPHTLSHQHHYALPHVERRHEVQTFESQDNATVVHDRHSPFSHSSPVYETLETKPAMNPSSPSGHDEEQMGFLESSPIHKEETHETGRTMVSQDKNEHLHQSLQSTAVRVDHLGEDFIHSQKLLETELQKTRTELSNLTKRFISLQASCSSTQQSNDLLQKKLSIMTQSMEDERERLNVRISVLTERLADAKFIDSDTEIISKTLSLHHTNIHFESDEPTNQMLPSIMPPPTQFTDSHDYDRPIVVGQEQSLGSVPEEEESDWSELGEETPRLILTRTANRNAAWRNQEVDVVNVRGHSAQIPHLHFTFHGEVLPSSGPKSPSEDKYRITSGPNLGSSILLRSASLGEIPVVHQQLQQELKSTEAMMDLYQPGSEVMEGLDDHIVHNWKTSNCVEAATGSSVESRAPEGRSNLVSLVSLQSAEQMLNSLISETKSSEGQCEDRAEVLGWTGGSPDEALNLEWTKL